MAEVAPAAEIVVTTQGSQAGSRYFVAADDSTLIVLNLTGPTLPTASRRVLRDMAAHHPEYFTAMKKGGTFAQSTVRIGREGVFVDNRKIADLEQVVETIARDDVSEIWGPVVARGSVPGAVLGGWIGFAVGAVPGLGGVSEEVAWLALISSAAVGGYLGFHWSSHGTDGIVYQAP